eukprot:NODE_252_length_12846_cov_0.309485.p8 type:complete len:161 gc:universal NODE_252_length_12846_cov_0.309485:1036-1518(+)
MDLVEVHQEEIEQAETEEVKEENEENEEQQEIKEEQHNGLVEEHEQEAVAEVVNELEEDLDEIVEEQQEIKIDENISTEEPHVEEVDNEKAAEDEIAVPMEIIEKKEESDSKIREEKKSADSFRDRLVQSSKRKTDSDSESKRFKPTPIKFEPIKFDEKK